MKKFLPILEKCPLFYHINPEDLAALLGCLKPEIKEFRKKDSILPEGSQARFVGIMLSGKAQIERTDYYGNRSIQTNIEPGELFGESFACANVPLPVNVVAVEESCVMLIDCKKIILPCSHACSFHGQLMMNLLHVVAMKNILLNQKAEITAKRSTREKLLAYLSVEAKKQGKSTFSIPFDRQELADYLQVDRSGLSNEISKLRDEGVLRSKKSQFTLL
ncbi:MAG: Crp/Fnr family transcriptional regulator [Clostridia bacterium]|nr:Crp/Fnr family transcriptional regulator [Clostridia bacterium]